MVFLASYRSIINQLLGYPFRVDRKCSENQSIQNAKESVFFKTFTFLKINPGEIKSVKILFETSFLFHKQ